MWKLFILSSQLSCKSKITSKTEVFRKREILEKIYTGKKNKTTLLSKHTSKKSFQELHVICTRKRVDSDTKMSLFSQNFNQSRGRMTSTVVSILNSSLCLQATDFPFEWRSGQLEPSNPSRKVLVQAVQIGRVYQCGCWLQRCLPYSFSRPCICVM